MRILFLSLYCTVTFFLSLQGHMLNITQARVTFDDSDQFLAEIDIDFSRALGSGDAYYQLSILPQEQQEHKIRELTQGVLHEVHFNFGDQLVVPELVRWEMPKATRQVFNDYSIGKMTKLFTLGTVPVQRSPFFISTLTQTMVEYPLAVTAENPSHQIRMTRWIELQGETSPPFNYNRGVAVIGSLAPVRSTESLSGASLSPPIRFLYIQLGSLFRYLGLGFHHIVPEGTDHILFVLGLFFFGITWKKLISQTTVFTLAHATTLYLSTQNIFTLPSWLVEPGIALSIAFVAIENIFQKKLNGFRLGVVFFFGLIHGLGFASGLKEIRLPEHEFFMALLGFNFGVDFGQLFIILLAFLVVGWFRNKPWYFHRIAMPCSCAIAGMGMLWAIERILFYAQIATI